MRYALISDIHGNEFALRAVLADASSEKIDRYLFLGDYCADVPRPNEVSDLVFSIKDALFVRGNKEDYLAGAHEGKSREWDTKQWAVVRWNVKTLKQDHLIRYLEMPNNISVPIGSGTLYAAHSACDFFGHTVADRIRTEQFCEAMRRAPFTHEAFLARIQRDLEAEGHALRPGDVYVFGHTHLQWYAKVKGALLVNPGSCGLPLDMNACAAYTILDDPEDGSLPTVTEKRVPYPVGDAVNAILRSPSYDGDSRIWYSIILLELKTGEEHVAYFLRALNRAARPPYTDEVWTTVGEDFLQRFE